MRAFNLYIGFGLVTLSGCLWFLAVTPFDMSALAWFAAVPMLLAVDRAPSWRRALLLGWWAGVIETAGGFYWLVDLMQRFGGFPWLGAFCVFLLFCATRALIFLLFTAVLCGIRRRRKMPMTLLAPIAMVGAELLVPQLFPCGQFISQAWHPLVIQIAELTGPWGVTALLMMVNGALYDIYAAPRKALIPASLAGILLAATLTFGAIRMRQVDELIAHAPRLAIGLVQPNFAYAMDDEFSRETALQQLHALQEQTRRLEHAGAQLVVWSEGAYPAPLPRDFTTDYPEESVAMIRRQIEVPLIIGAITFEAVANAAANAAAGGAADADQEDGFNSALLLDRNGNMTGRYDKVRLLAFGEYVPGIEYFPWLRNWLPSGTGRFKAGSGPGILKFDGGGDGRDGGRAWNIGPVICYEDLLPGFLRKVGRLRPNLLVNLTSDSWFGAPAEPWEHLALAVFATVELRVSLVRSVNSGISAFIDPNGRLLQKTYADDPYRAPRAADGIVVSVPWMPGSHTVYVAFGNWFCYLCIAATALAGWFAARRPDDSPDENLPL